MKLQSVPVLQQQFSRETPFGPAATPPAPEISYLDIYHATERFEKSLTSRHNIVFGRRGAGKSSLVQRIFRGNEYDIKIILEKDAILEVLKGKLKGIDPNTIYCESIARLWIHLFWLAVFKHILATEKDTISIRHIREYLHVTDDDYKLTVTQCVARWIDRQTATTDVHTSFPAAVLQGILSQRQSGFNEARDEAIEWLAGRSLIILLDSLERYYLNEDIEQKLVGGLLKASGLWQSHLHKLFIKVFFPSELFFRIKQASENEARDFEHAILLKWNARDLFELLVKRLLIFERVHGISKVLDEFDRLSDKSRMELCRRIWTSRFPEKITNSFFKISEDSIAYFMRHCQLLPRQVFILGNRIAENYRWPTEGITRYRFTHDDFKTGVRMGEKSICSEIFKSFSVPYPDAHRVAERYLRHLRARLRLPLVYEVKARLSEREFEIYKSNPMLFERMLIELGIIGRRIEDGESAYYYRAEFEYYLPDQLHVTEEDDLVVHPIFLETYNVPISRDTCPRAIYPQGADLEELAAF